MRNDGRALEELVEYVEKTLANEGFQVNVNRKIHNDEGVQIAEFDVTVKGRFGSTEISWLIECRDRPSSGKAPGEWIYALAGKRDVHQFNKVTAVSTMGFSPAAVLAAEKLDVELREVAATSPEAFSSWLKLAEVELLQHDISLADIDFVLDKNFITSARDCYLQQLISSPDGRQRAVLVSGVTGAKLDVNTACREALAVAGGFNVVEPGGDAVEIDMTVEYEAADAHLLMETPDGNVRVRKIRFQGSVRAVLKKFPVVGHSVYRAVCSEGAIAQTASANIPLPSGETVALTFTKVVDCDQYQVNWKTTR
ncbi:MAG: hypothetical protein U1E04_08970 [Hylemonella sp.]|nr:hypothetical protein [Hylemonella sp.]